MRSLPGLAPARPVRGVAVGLIVWFGTEHGTEALREVVPAPAFVGWVGLVTVFGRLSDGCVCVVCGLLPPPSDWL